MTDDIARENVRSKINEIGSIEKRKDLHMDLEEMQQTDAAIVVQKFVQQEEGLVHPTYDQELEFYQMVSEGQVKWLQENNDYDTVDDKCRGVLSDDAIQNLRYHIVVTIAMISRMCIEKGMEEDESYQLSDYYIRCVDRAKEEKELRKLHKKAVLDYAKRMLVIQKKDVYSIHCVKAMDFVKAHLHEKLDLQTIAEAVDIERTYLSKLFHKEVGCTIFDYIRSQRLMAAENMLIYSDYNVTEIAALLAFPSASYMGKEFRKKYGMTPLEFRKKNFRKHWTI